MEVLDLLEKKNEYLRLFLETTVLFCESFNENSINRLASFHAQRETILKAIERFDLKLTEAIQDFSKTEKNEEIIREAQKRFLEKEDLILKIEKIDRILVAKMGVEKERLHSEISSGKKGKRLINKFKSSQGDKSGMGLDSKL